MTFLKKTQASLHPIKKRLLQSCRTRGIKPASQKGRHLFQFYRAILNNPRNVGAICPSFPALAKAIAKNVVYWEDSLVIELGAGTGVVTKALLNQGIHQDQLIVIETSATLVKHLKKEFPTIRVIQGDAANLIRLLGTEDRDISSIVSSIPLRAIPRKKANKIIGQITQLLKGGRRYIQFTYSVRRGDFFIPQQFKHIHCDKVWLNLPPARIDVYESTGLKHKDNNQPALAVSHE